MAWAVSAEPSEFDEAIAWFRSRVPVTDDEYNALSASAKTRAFHLASVNELQVVQTVFKEIERAIAEGLPLETFQASVSEKLGAAHRLNGYHLETVFRNGTQDAYNAGRWEQLTSLDVSSTRPYWMYDAVLDDRTTPLCKSLDGTIKAHDDPYWLTHCPPLHHRCRGGIRALRRSEADRRGITVGDPQTVGEPGQGFGLAPPLRTELPMPDRTQVDNDVLSVFDARRATDPDNDNT